MFDFGWVLLLAALAGIFSVRFKIPPVVGLLFAGMLIGPNLLNVVDQSTIEIIAEVGSILLLFMVGVEFSIAKLFSTGLRAVISGFLLILIMFAAMHEVSIILGFDSLSSLFLASVFSMSSTAIMMKILEQKKLLERTEVPLLIIMLIIEDIVAVFLLTFFSNLTTNTYDPQSIFGAILLSLGILIFCYVILLRALRKLSIIFFRYQTEDTLTMVSLALGIGMSALASLLGLTPAVGAFLAGSIVAGLPNGKDFERSIRPFSVVFSSFFFLSVGMLIDPTALFVSLDVTVILVISYLIAVFLTTSFVFYLIGSDGKSAIFAGIAMLPLGEFSLLIARESVGIVPINLVSIVSVGVLFSSILCSFSLRKYDKIYLAIKTHTPQNLLDTLKHASGYFRNVMTAFEPKGYFHTRLVNELTSIRWDLAFVTVASVSLWFSRSLLRFPIAIMGYTASADFLVFLVFLLVSIIPLYRILSSFRRLLDTLSTVFSQTTGAAQRSIILRNLIISIIFFAVFVNYPLLIEWLVLPRIFIWFSLVFGVLSVFFFWSAIRASSVWFMISGRRPIFVNYPSAKASSKDLIIVASSRHRKKKQPKKEVLTLS
ncbi:Glutathione-regulated potassium-efflux system protein KefB [Candidatus Bilamarchaeum dharawalense]|uniref:Glutathione-regulated potassium-efflux system protein KefB n=1 Tax=Candidatus Bilamarchaeum dharawalense TaxID=2885759 RepID=A0A5E4LWP7_9ARCH|nr:Glutathione-regulated potassium-efflux system protein KefB [Candidatus Bilamarchaeum dharawalense]